MSTDNNLPFADVRGALRAAGPCIDPETALHAQAALDDAERRFETVGDHTVVALVGGTGSGKSSLFNALTRSHFADDGFLRPTTRRASACVWGPGGDALLDFLGVDAPRRMHIDPTVQPADAPASGLVLLDLPDNDSVEETHLIQVEQLLPVVDVLVWVVDPQKYADHLLHENHLRVLSRRADAMVVVLNHVDTLTPQGRDTVMAAIEELLVRDGLAGVDVLTTCALDGTGVDALWDRLVAAVGVQSTAERTARAEIAKVAHQLLEQVGSTEAQVDDAVIDSVVDQFLAAAGVPAVVEALQQQGVSPVRPLTPGRAAAAAIGSEWAARATAGLPPRWVQAVEEKLPAVTVLQETVQEALNDVAVPERTVPTARRAGGLVALLAALGLAGWLFFAPPLPWLVGTGAVLALGVAGWLLGGLPRAQRRHNTQLAQLYQDHVRQRMRTGVRDVLVMPAVEVLETHEAVRTTLEKAQNGEP